MATKRTLRRRIRRLRGTVRLLEKSLQTLVGSNRRLIEGRDAAWKVAGAAQNPIPALGDHPADSVPVASAYREDEA